MLKLSIKCVNHAISRRQISQSHYFTCYGNLKNLNGVSYAHSSHYSTESGCFPKSPDLVRIYEGPLATRLKRTKLFSFTTSAVGITGFPVVAEQIQKFPEKTGWYLAVLSVMSFFSFGTPVLLQLLASKYILYIDYNQSKDLYTLYTYTLFFGLKPASFNATDVSTVSTPLASVSIRGKGYLLEASNFTDLNHYKRMVGYDKEFDFSDNNEIESTSCEPNLKRPKIPMPTHQTPKASESIKPSDEDKDLPLNLRKRNR
nr:PREDICTED: uncharacterized protein LOC109044111 [Bemisia tabaci]